MLSPGQSGHLPPETNLFGLEEIALGLLSGRKIDLSRQDSFLPRLVSSRSHVHGST